MVRSKMVLHGWQENQHLPKGWRFKVKTGNQYQYCTEKGDIIIGNKKTLFKLKTTDVEAVKGFIKFTKNHNGSYESLLGEICDELGIKNNFLA